MARTIYPSDGSIRRQRVCKGEGEHRIWSREEFEGWRLRDARVRRTSDRKVATAFDQARLLRDLAESTLGKLSLDQSRDVVTNVVVGLQSRIANGEVERVEIAPGSGVSVLVLDDSTIRDEVEKQLLSAGHSIAHILYALTFRGRSDHGAGWNSAEDVLAWLYSEPVYPQLRGATAVRPSVHESKWAPRPHGKDPDRVVKASRGDRRPQVETFDLAQFQRSIQTVMVGRPQARHRAEYISWYVLRPLHGQSMVTSAQLGVGVEGALRRIDDIAYLRWVTAMKDMWTVEQFHDEARGLIL
ncbi:hypothetical protein, partial [Rhodococcus sp. IEGM 1408]|uniref:hypothetical protein n=1 Tax=Rhodococcus sp. IEGM 1408 TaxID=3082220 RepID=UPI0029547017